MQTFVEVMSRCVKGSSGVFSQNVSLNGDYELYNLLDLMHAQQGIILH